MRASIVLDEGVAPTLLTLFQIAICGVKGHGHGQSSAENSSSTSSVSPVKLRSHKGDDFWLSGMHVCIVQTCLGNAVFLYVIFLNAHLLKDMRFSVPAVLTPLVVFFKLDV